MLKSFRVGRNEADLEHKLSIQSDTSVCVNHSFTTEVPRKACVQQKLVAFSTCLENAAKPQPNANIGRCISVQLNTKGILATSHKYRQSMSHAQTQVTVSCV